MSAYVKVKEKNYAWIEKMRISMKTAWKGRQYYMLLLPGLVYLIIFSYIPMYGVQIAFKDYKMSLGIIDSKWVGFKHFINFFKGYNFGTLIKNTFSISLYSLTTFPIPIVVALLLNEVKGKLKRVTQTILYAPHFISTVVMVGMMTTMFSPTFGVVNKVLNMIGQESYYFMAQPKAFRHLYVWSGVWQEMGWGAIVYLAALAAVDPALLEAAAIDGASRLQRIWHINIPTILPTIVIMLILRLGSIASVGYEKVYLMQNDMNIEVSQIISTYVYERGIVNTNYSFSSAVGLFNNVINITMLLLANWICKKVSKNSLF